MQKDTQRIQNRLNVFSGPDAVKDFLNPDCNPPLPLVEIPKHLNLFAKDGVRVFAKLMNFLPLANVKSLPAYNMLLEKENGGGLDGITSLIENSSGNTVFSLAVIGRLFGIAKTKAIVSHEVSWGKLQMLRFFGTEVMVNEEPICPDPSDKESGIYKAKQIGEQEGWFNPGQYDNEANPRAHEQWTGPADMGTDARKDHGILCRTRHDGNHGGHGEISQRKIARDNEGWGCAAAEQSRARRTDAEPPSGDSLRLATDNGSR